MEEQDIAFKLILFGDGGVGKTTLVERFMTGLFKEHTQMTIGADFHRKRLKVEGKNVTLQIWDFAGEERFRYLFPGYIKGASGGIFMYDITRYMTLRNLESWLEVIDMGLKEEKQFPIVMAGGKADLFENRSVDNNEAYELATEKKFYAFVECSAKTGENVEDIFQSIARIMMQNAGLI